MERETDAIFRQITEDLEAEFSAIDRSGLRDLGVDPVRRALIVRGVALFAVGACATIVLGLLNPLLGGAAFLGTVLAIGRPR